MSELAMVKTDMLALNEPFGDEGDAARAAAADRAMEKFSGVLAEPEYTGEVQTALIHHMRRDAFDWYLSENMVEEVLKLEDRIAEAAESKSDSVVPLVMSYQITNGSGSYNRGRPNFETALVAVDSEQHFRSTLEHKRDIHESGFASPIAITTRSLSLVGSTVRVPGLDLADFMGLSNAKDQDVAALNTLWRERKPEDGLVLHQTKLKSGRNSTKPSADHGVRGGAIAEIDRLYNNQVPLVGWGEVTSAVLERTLDVLESTDSDQDGKAKSLSYVSGIRGLFERVNQLDALLAHSGPELRKVLRSASGFTEALGALAMKERPPQLNDYDI